MAIDDHRQQHEVLERIEQTLDLIQEANHIGVGSGAKRCCDVSWIVPVYNQGNALPRLLQRIEQVMPVTTQIIVVDDGSNDGTSDWLAQQPPLDHLRVIRRRRHHGRGSSIRLAIRHCQGTVIAIQDTESGHDPADLLPVIWPVLDGDAEVVFGSNRLADRTDRSRWDQIGNWLATRFSNAVTGLRLTDAETHCRAFDAEFLKSIALSEPDSQIDAEITAKIASRGARMIEIPLQHRGWNMASERRRPWRDRLAAVHRTWKYRRS